MNVISIPSIHTIMDMRIYNVISIIAVISASDTVGISISTMTIFLVISVIAITLHIISCLSVRLSSLS